MLKTTSPWLDTVPDEKRFPSLSGQIQTDLVVVGGGIVGVLTAWNLVKKGIKVVLLEKNHIATGDTGFTTAFITRVPDTACSGLAEKYGIDFLKKIFKATTAAQERLRNTLKEEKIDCDFSDCYSYECAYAPNDEALKAEWGVIKEADPQAKFVTGSQAAESGAPIVEAIRFDREARYNVRKFLFGLLARPQAKLMQVFEESEVVDIQVHTGLWKRGVTVKTSNGTVKAKKVVITTGLPMRSFSELSELFTSNITFALAVNFPKGVPFSDNLFWDTDEPYQYYRRFDPNIVILGGADRRADEKPDPKAPKSHDFLANWLKDRFKKDFTVTNTWSGNLFDSSDGLPYASEHPHYRGLVYIGSGFGGNGMVMGGGLAGWLLADLATGTSNEHAKLFSFERTGAKIPKPAPRPGPSLYEKSIPALRFILPIIYLIAFLLPGYVFFQTRQGLTLLQGANFKAINLFFFPLIGLYAFFLVWAQIILGSSMNPLRKIFPWIETFHRTEGVFALLFALTHPILILLGTGIDGYLKYKFVDRSLIFFVWLGYLQLSLMILTVTTALLMKLPWLRKHWHTIHYANYLVFVSVWIHSWFLGTDVQPTSLKYLWYFFGLTAIASTIGRVARIYMKPKKVARAGVAAFIKVATVNQVKEDAPFCAMANGQKFALFKLGSKYYAIDNTCSHAGGPLCQGTLEGSVIECPWHGSKFNVTTGEVVGPPARTPQAKYEVRVSGSDIEVKV